MDVASLKFALLAIISVFMFYLIRGKMRMAFLTVLSLLFIASFSYSLLIYVVTYSLVNYLLGVEIYRSKYKVTLFRTGIVINLLQLFILKYASFVIDPVLFFFNSQVIASKISEIIIPVGISYFTLQGIGYLINVKMGWEKPEKNFIKFTLYLTFYPKFVSGPIERSNHFLPQINETAEFDQKNITEGFRLIFLGFIKKLVVANQLGLFINPVYQNIDSYEGSTLLLVLILQPLFLYFDFSGYTDIAIGVARAYGIKLLPNFDRPFFAENVTTFWKRFHISLASWFNDYIFKQLSFRLRQFKNLATLTALCVTWTLFGIWHGAGWNFMILGALQAVAISYEFFTKRIRLVFFSVLPQSIRIWIGRLITYLFYGVSLVFFFSKNFNTTLLFFSKLRFINICLPVICKPITKAFFVSNYVDIISYFFTFTVLIIFLVFEMISNDNKSKYEQIKIFWTSSEKKYQTIRFLVYYAGILLLFYYGGIQTNFIYYQF